MRLKLDENLGSRGEELFRDAGHDIATVSGQGLASAGDHELISICRAERRRLVTLDLDFANPLVFAPNAYSGIAVLRLPRRASDRELWDACRTLIAGVAETDMAGRLWIVRPGRIREYRPEPFSPDD